MAVTPVQGKVARKYMAHFIDTSFGLVLNSAAWARLGKDLEEMNVELNPDTSTFTNIIGETQYRHNGYDPSSDASPYYAEVGDALFEKLQGFVDKRETGDALKTYVMEAHLWEDTEGGDVTAYVQAAYVTPQSYGGDTSGYQIPFTLSYVGDRIKGKVNQSTHVFTPDQA